jgi:hypothetical protein
MVRANVLSQPVTWEDSSRPTDPRAGDPKEQRKIHAEYFFFSIAMNCQQAKRAVQLHWREFE